ncbi:arginine decarboxylase, pyruvoyl-dependent [Candidatus Falkowbacteria bacterium RBG_13_39_14]|uniref:Pyruvoyl-dependent arginine decarboxylase AaxB n=1 Tax=Candidatus Falkowbacteria bacterium RBG_13_39_14 TaxID=1797985 RepID=A0A1F5S8L0_9BACT|nr:MAG: arginine decarboxylase, pyruvoyl-dependent [Candidatus Falkowbacteria bacterium RBG_13_39_14]
MIQTPNKFFLAAGTSEGLSKLNAIDGALISAGVGNTNLVKMSSICPPRCVQIEQVKLPSGALIPVAYASRVSENKGEIISSAVAIAFPEDESQPGLIMEFSAEGTRVEAENKVREMAKYGVEVTRGWRLKEIISIAAEHKVAQIGASFAGVVLWW